MVVADHDAVTAPEARILELGHGGIAPVIQAYAETPSRFATPIIVPLDCIAGHTAGNRAGHCGRGAAITLAHRAAEHATRDRADHCTESGGTVAQVHAIHVGDFAAVRAYPPAVVVRVIMRTAVVVWMTAIVVPGRIGRAAREHQAGNQRGRNNAFRFHDNLHASSWDMREVSGRRNEPLQNECNPCTGAHSGFRAPAMTTSVYAFAEYRLDPAARELWRDGALVTLPPKSFDCLVYLIGNHERAVGRDELISAVWGRADVSDALLAQTLLRARRAIGDTGNRQTTIRTVPRFGYRWIGRFEEMTANEAPDAAPSGHGSAAAGTTHPDTDARERPRPAQRFRLAGVAAMLLVVAVLAFAGWRKSAHAPPAAPIASSVVQPAIVVLPVEIPDASAESAWIRLGVMDYVSRRLRESGQFTVLPSEQVVALAGAADALDGADIERIARATRAHWVVQPSMRHTERGWVLRLVIGDGTEVREADGRADRPLEAAALASAQLLQRLGADLATEREIAPPGALAERIQRVDAALLGGDIDAARRLVEGATPEERADPGLQVREAQIDFRAGRQRAAAERFAAIGESKAHLPADVRAQALMGLGAVAVRRADYAAAEKRYAEALAVLGDEGDANLVGNAFGGRGVARGAQSQFERALSDLGRARIALDRAGNPLDAASVDTNWGLIESARARFSQALPHFDRAIATFERFDVRDNLAASLLGKARAELAMLDLGTARASSTRAWELARGLENTTLLRNVAVAHAQILIEAGQLAAAGTVLRGMPPGDDTVSAQQALLGARLAMARADPVAAEALLRPSMTGELRDYEALPAYVAAGLASGEAARARAAFDAAARSAPDETADRLAMALADARLALHDADDERADRAFRQAVSLADRSGVPLARARAIGAYARFLIERGRLEPASALVGELAPYADRDFRVAQVTRDLYEALGDPSLAATAANRTVELAGERDPRRPPW